MLARTSLFLCNRSQAVRLPKAVAFADEVREVVIVSDGPRQCSAPGAGGGPRPIVMKHSVYAIDR